jgi:hypothetical protein
MPIKRVQLTRDQLYDLLWAAPITKVAERYHLSDAGLKRICTKHRIPRTRAWLLATGGGGPACEADGLAASK